MERPRMGEEEEYPNLRKRRAFSAKEEHTKEKLYKLQDLESLEIYRDAFERPRTAPTIVPFRDNESLQEEIINLKKLRNELEQDKMLLKVQLAKKDEKLRKLKGDQVKIQVTEPEKKPEKSAEKKLPSLKVISFSGEKKIEETYVQLEKKNADLKRLNSSLKLESENFSKQVKLLQTKVRKLKAMIKQLQQPKSTIAEEDLTPQAPSQEMIPISEPSLPPEEKKPEEPKLLEMDEALKKLKEQHKELKRQVREKEENKELVTLREHVARLTEENKTLEESIQKELSKGTDQSLKILENEAIELRDSHMSLMVEHNQLKNHVEVMKEQLQELNTCKEENEGLKSKILEVESKFRVPTEVTKPKDSEWKMSGLEDQIDILWRNIHELPYWTQFMQIIKYLLQFKNDDRGRICWLLVEKAAFRATQHDGSNLIRTHFLTPTDWKFTLEELYTFLVIEPDQIPESEVFYYIEVKYSGKVLQASSDRDRIIYQASKSPGSIHQQFKLVPTGKDTYFVVLRSEDHVFHIHGGQAGNDVHLLHQPKTGGSHQQFRVIPAGNGFVFLQAVHSGRVLTMRAPQQNQKSQVIQYDQQASLAQFQQFKFVRG